MSAPLTPQEKSVFSRYGNNNFTFDAFKKGSMINQMGSEFAFKSGPVPYRHQDELSGKKQKLHGDYKNMAVDFRRQMSRAAIHTPFNYVAPLGGGAGPLHQFQSVR